MDIKEHSTATGALARAVARLLRPLIRLLMAHGIGYPQLREMLKALYVDVATEALERDGARATDSRLFLLTGVHRKDIKRLRGQTDDAETGGTATLSGAIAARWLGDPAFLDADGQPRCLPRKDDAHGPGFDTLVARVSKDVRPRTILDEWLRLGMVEIDARQQVCLRRDAFVPGTDFTEQSFYLGRNVHDHLAACVHNMEQGEPPFFERSVYYSGLTQASVDELRAQAQQEGTALLHRLNQRALALKARDADADDNHRRMRFGGYWFEDDSDATGENTQ